VLIVSVVLLCNWKNKELQRVRREEEKKIGEEGGARAHRFRQKQAEMAAEVADSNEELLCFGDSSGEREKRGEGGLRGAL
jgi:hypothetical protein